METIDKLPFSARIDAKSKRRNLARINKALAANAAVGRANGYTVAKLHAELGFTYLGSATVSAKAEHTKIYGVNTYILYLAPWNLSGRNICPAGARCHQSCLATSGHGKIDVLSGKGTIERARINRTNAFFTARNKFMWLLEREILLEWRKAIKAGNKFAVRLNGTSDISPRAFRFADGKNILERYSDVQFYDYTKVVARLRDYETYANYHITFSFDGGNMENCEKAIQAGVNVAMVFLHKDENGRPALPETFHGKKVFNATQSDARFLDPTGQIAGLIYRPIAADVTGAHDPANDPFIVKTQAI